MINLEGVNIRFPYRLPELMDVIVVDLSFISLRLVLANIVAMMKSGGHLITLIKPQFEVGPEGVNQKGVVRNLALVDNVIHDILSLGRSLGLEDVKIIKSPVTGKTGNQEFLAYWRYFNREL